MDHLIVHNFLRTQIRNLLLCGLSVYGFAGYTAYNELQYADWIKINGRVTEMKTYQKEGSSKKENLYDFVVTYEFEGQERTIKKEKFSGPPKFTIGDIRPVEINPKNTKDARTYSGSPIGFIKALIILGTILSLLSIPGFIKKKK